jgi:hypothetical protein
LASADHWVARKAEVVDHVVERQTSDGHRQTVHVAEIRSTHSPWIVNLAEEYLLRRTRLRSPSLHATLKTSQLRVVELPRILGLKPRKQHLRLQTGCLLQLLMHLRAVFSSTFALSADCANVFPNDNARHNRFT